MSDPLHNCTVAVPVYRESPSRTEVASLRQCARVLGTRWFSLFGPEGMDFSAYADILRNAAVEFRIERFPARYFSGVKAYNALLLQPSFYRAHSDSEFILLHQLDAWVFRDELDSWCRKGFDFVGAPWFAEYGAEGDLWAVGNGGFSLRRVRTALRILSVLEELRASSGRHRSDEIIPDDPRTRNQLRLLLEGDLDDSSRWDALPNEDAVWGLLGPRLANGCRVPTPTEAVAFSFERSPEILYGMNGHKLPFGCHAWEKHGKVFWREFIAADGAEPSVGKESPEPSGWDVLARASVLLDSGKSEEAGALLESSDLLEKKDAEFQRGAGLLLLRAGKLNEARVHFLVSTRLAPECAQAHLDLGVAWMMQARYTEAESSFRRVLELSPGNGEAWKNLGRLHLRRKETVAGVEAYAKAMELLPEDPECLVLVGGWLALQGDSDRARTLLEKASALCPQDAGIRTELEKLAQPLAKGISVGTIPVPSLTVPPRGSTETFLPMAPIGRGTSTSAASHWIGRLSIRDFGTGEAAFRGIVRHILENKAGTTAIMDRIRLDGTIVFPLSLELRSRKSGTDAAPLGNLADLDPEFAASEGPVREADILAYRDRFAKGEEAPPASFVTGAYLNSCGADVGPDELWMIDGARRIAAQALLRRTSIQAEVLTTESHYASLLPESERTALRERVKGIRWFASYQSIPLVGLEGDRTTNRFGLMDLSRLRGCRVADWGCNLGQASVRAALAGASEVVGLEGMPDTFAAASEIRRLAGLSNLRFAQVDFNAPDLDLRVDAAIQGQVDWSFFFSVYRTKELVQRDRLFQKIIDKTAKGIFFEGHADKVIDTIDYYRWLFESYGLEWKHLGNSEGDLRPLFLLTWDPARQRRQSPFQNSAPASFPVRVPDARPDPVRPTLAEPAPTLPDAAATTPLVTAIVSTYASAAFLRGRLENLLAQTLGDRLEVVVIDSCSPENDAEIAREFARRDPRVRVVRTSERETIYKAWNRGVEMARGKYLTNANTDDILRGDALERLAAELDSHPGIDLGYGDFWITHEPNQTFLGSRKIGYSLKPEFSPSIMLTGCHMGPQPMWRRSLHDRFGLFDPDFHAAGDYEFWCRCAAGGAVFRHVPEFLGLYLHNQAGLCNGDVPRVVRESAEVQRRYGDMLPAAPTAFHAEGFYRKEPLPENAGFVNIGMVTWNRLEFTKQAIEAVWRKTRHPYVLTVVDNGSTDGTREWLGEMHRQGAVSNLVLLPENVGVARASNLAWSAVPEAGYFLKLDSDMVALKPDWLERMVETAVRIPTLGALGYSVEPRSYPSETVDGVLVRPKREANIGGACFLVPKAVHERLGWWCEDYGLYGEEDGDFALRIRLAGLFNAYMEDEDAFSHLPGGKAGAIDPRDLSAIDPEELRIHEDYRLWKDDLRRELQKNGGLLQRNVMAYHSGQRSLFVPRGRFQGLLGPDLQVFQREDIWEFHPVSGDLSRSHRDAVEGFAAAKSLGDVVTGSDLTPSRRFLSIHPIGAGRGKSKTTIVIPVHGHLDLTRQCLEAVRRTTDPSTTEIVVVDDASPDGTAAWLREQESRTILKAIFLSLNRGFAAACNAGAKAASGRTLVFLNNDTIPEAGWLDALVRTLEQNPSAGMVGARLLYPDRTIQHAGILFHPGGAPYHVHRGLPAEDPSVRTARAYPAVTGACVAIPGELFEKLGGFDESFHMYVEDIDLCLKVWDAGLEVRYCPDSVVVHLESASAADLDRRDAMVESGLGKLHGRWRGRWPAGLLALEDWPRHFRKGPPLRWIAPMLRMGERPEMDRRIATFLDGMLPNLQVEAGSPDPRFMEELRKDADSVALWKRLLSNPLTDAVPVFSASAAPDWRTQGRQRGHICFVAGPDDLRDADAVDCASASSCVWVCGDEALSMLRGVGIENSRLVALPSANRPEFAASLLAACAVAMERDRHDPTAEVPGSGPIPKNRPALHWITPALNFTGYARLNREALLAVEKSDACALSLDPTATDREFVKGLELEGEAAVAPWNGILSRKPVTGELCLVSDLPCNLKRLRDTRPGFRRYAGLTMFETDRLPRGWKDDCLEMDEIWVPSTFNLQTFSESGVPERMLKRIPCGIDMDRFKPGAAEALALQGRRRLNFLSVFDWNLRKGWDVLLLAWADAFDSSDDVSLTLKARMSKGESGEIARTIRDFYGRRGVDRERIAPIVVVEGDLPDRSMPGLYAAADVFVLPTRGEGWGLPILEAMASGLPAIATGWSAHLDFLDGENGYPIEHRLVPVDPEQTRASEYYGSDHLWAEPSREHLVELLRARAGDPREARDRGLRARSCVETEWSSRRTAEWIVREASRPGLRIAKGAPNSESAGRAGIEARAMRIGIDGRTLSVPDSFVRGIGHYALHHLLALLEERPDAEVTVLVDDRDPMPGDVGERLVKAGASFAPWSSRTARDFDVVHVPDPMHTYPGFASPFHRFASARLTASFYDIIPLRVYPGRIPNWPGYLARLDQLRDTGTTLLCISEFTRSDLLAATSVDPRNARVVMAGFNASDSGKVGNRSEGDALLSRLGIEEPFFLHVGAADPHKNFETALTATQSAGRSRRCRLVVVGHLAKALALARDNVRASGLSDVVFTGFLPREELELLYSRAVATLFLSRYEGFGFPALEAMANGCPVVCSNAASIPEVVGDAALMHEPDDVDGVTRSLVLLLDDPAVREELVAKGRKRATAFRWSEVARRTWQVWDELAAAPSRPFEPPPRPARVQWISPVWDPSGYGDESRAFLRHLAGTDLGVGVYAWGRHSESFHRAASPGDRALFDGLMGRETVSSPIAVLDLPGSALGKVDGARYNVGRTTFETDGLSPEWIAHCGLMDEIWVPSRFNRETFSNAGVTKPILVVPEGVDTNKFRPGLQPLEIPGAGRGTTFLSVFEWTHRKGPDVLLRAWALAFGPDDDVRLVLRTYPPNEIEGDPAAWVDAKIEETLREIGSSRSRCAPIEVLARQVPDSDMPRLYAATDVYLAPSRGEGWGRPHMEAMSCGVPVVATRWSGNLDFQDDNNSWLVDIEGLEEIDAKEEFPFYRGQKWAKPSVDHLSQILRTALDPDLRRSKGARARRDMVEGWDWSRIAPLAETRLREILAGVPASASALSARPAPAEPVPEPPSGPSAPTIRWCGDLFNFSGYAGLARNAVSGLMDASVPVTADPQRNDRNWFPGISLADRARWTELLSRAPKPGVLVCCDVPRDANGRNELFDQMGAANPGNPKRVGWTMFETDRLPAGWADSLNRLDEVWVPSEFNRRTFSAAGVEPGRIHVVPGCVDASRYGSGLPYPLPGGRKGTTFLSVFQWVRRKGWDVLLRAWADAFDPRADVRLVLRCHPFGKDASPMRDRFLESLEELGLSESKMASILLLDGFVPESEMPSLYLASDVFVLPSRGEGWGLPYLEAMASGKPCIATAWGASSDFLNEDNAWLASPRDTVPVGETACRENPYLSTDHRWADPDPAEVARLLRKAASNIVERERKGIQARFEAATRWSPETTARAIAARGRVLLGIAEPVSARAVPQLRNASGTKLSGALEKVAGGLLASSGKRATAAPAEPAKTLSVRWEGSQFVHHSLALVNREICLRLARRGHDLSLIPWEPDQFGPGDDPDLAILERLRKAPLEGPCQVHVRHQWPPLLEPPAEGKWVVVQPWEFGSPPLDWMPVFRDRIDALWVPSTYCRDLYARAGVPEDRIRVVPNGVDTDRFRPGLQPLPGLEPDGRITFLYVGGTIPRKGFDVLLNAWRQAFGSSDPVRLLVKSMGGDTFYKGQTGEAMVQELNASGTCAPVVHIDRDLSLEELPRIYASGDVLVHPYRGEGFGLPIAEAMSCGLPVVVTRGGASDDFCGDAESWGIPATRVDVPGGVVGPFRTVAAPWWLEPSAEKLAEILREVAGDEPGRRAKGRAGRRRILSNWTWDRAADAAEAALREVAGRPGVRRDRDGAKAPDAPAPETVSEADLLDLNRILFRAEAAAGRGEFGEAEVATLEAVETHPDQHLAWLARAMVLRGLRKFPSSIEAVRKSIALRESPDALLESVLIHRLAGQDSQAKVSAKLLKERHGEWLAATRALYASKGQAWPLDPPPKNGKKSNSPSLKGRK
jgi:glycosyltransferase involved in cell wall biosynthesis/GT2 family glycosyltransferase/Flp pilus assembly protein TadD